MRLRDKIAFVSVMFGCALGASSSAYAGFIGDSFTASYDFPTATTLYNGQQFGPTTATGANPVFQLNQDLGAPGIVNVGITNNQITFGFNFSNSWTSVPFNGVELTDLSNPFPTLTLDPGTNMPGFTASDITVSGNTLFVNWQGLSFNPDMHVTVSAVPEPATVTLLGAGLIGGLGALRRRKKTQARG